jgi:hypothetical protein
MYELLTGKTILTVWDLREIGVEKFEKVRDAWGKRAHTEPLVDGRVVLIVRPGGATDLVRG